MKILHHIFPANDRGTLNSDWDYSLLAERPIPRKSVDETPKVEQENSNLDSPSKEPDSRAVNDSKMHTAVNSVNGGCRCVVM